MSEAAASKPAAPKSSSTTEGELARSPWVFAGVSLLVALGLLLGLHFGVGVAFDGPTLALAAACIVLFWALRAMWGVVVALSRPAVETLVVEAELGADHSTLAELREEKRRVLRAIKELEFDHAMGKLSDEDFREVGDRYRLRAIEVLRQLDGSDELHPTLAEHLAALGVAVGREGVTGEAATDADEATVASATEDEAGVDSEAAADRAAAASEASEADAADEGGRS
jgi:hypothetical protein